MTTQNPAEYRDDLGELVHAHRLYTGLSQRTIAERIGIKERSLSDIEIGRRSCPPGFLDAIAKVVDAFDADVDAAVANAQKLLDATEDGDDAVHVRVSLRASDEWQRVVLGRAAVTSGLIVPEAPPFVQS